MLRALILTALAWLMISAQGPNAQGVAENAPAVEGQAANGTDRAQQPASVATAPVTVRIVEDADQARHAQEREAKADKHDSEDLKAQQRAAAAAESQWWPAFAASFFGFVGTVLIVGSLWMTWRALKISQGAERAYLTFKPPEKFMEEDWTAFIIHLHNIGATPARLYEFHAKEFEGVLPDAEAYFNTAGFSALVETIPRGEHSAISIALPVGRNKRSNFVFAARYRDIFGREHKSRRAISLDGRGLYWTPVGGEEWNRED